MSSTLTTWDAFLKNRYTPDKIENLTLSDRPLLAKVAKDPSCSGKQWNEPVLYGNPQGLGATITAAQAGATQAGDGANSLGVDFVIPWGDYVGSVNIGDKVIEASRDNAGALLDNKTAEIDGLYNGCGDVFAAYLYGDSGHNLGTFTESSGVCTLANTDDIVNFYIGMQVQASANDGTSNSHTLLGSGSIGYVIAVSESAGTFTVSATSGGTAGTPSSWTGTMYAFRYGDFGGSGATAILTGLAGWIPSSAPTSTAFYSVDRSVHESLGGVRLASADYTGANIETRLKRLVTRMIGRNRGPGPSDIFMNPEKWQDLSDALEARGQRSLSDDSTKFGFEKLQLRAAGKVVNVFADRFCPVGTAFALKLDSWKLRSMREIPHVLKGDGLTMLRSTSANNYEHRIVAYPAFMTNAPGWNGRAPMP